MNNVIRRHIRDHKIFEIPPNIEMGSREGMQTLDMAMANLVVSGAVALESAQQKTGNPAKLNEWLQRFGRTSAGEPTYGGDNRGNSDEQLLISRRATLV